jgi:mRNA-degrading endonuclease RelE of RelBE toxin-antitoxin system
MNRILVTDAFAQQLIEERGSEELKQLLHAGVRRIADDPMSQSVSVPFEQYPDIRAARIGGYRVLFTFDPKKSELYLLSLLSPSEP